MRTLISHSSGDNEWVLPMAEQLRQLGIEPYLYEYDVQPGRIVSDKVRQAIDMSDVVVVFLTRHSTSSTYVAHEVGYALGKNKLVMPLVEPGVDRKYLGMLDGAEYVPFDTANPEKGTVVLGYLLQKHAAQLPAQLAQPQQPSAAQPIGAGASGAFVFSVTSEMAGKVLLALFLVALGAYLLYNARGA